MPPPPLFMMPVRNQPLVGLCGICDAWYNVGVRHMLWMPYVTIERTITRDLPLALQDPGGSLARVVLHERSPG
jgi:hypothetical protein